MSYGFYRLPPHTSAQDYVTATAKDQSVIIAVGIPNDQWRPTKFQGNDVSTDTSNIPGDDQSMPQLSQNTLLATQKGIDPTSIDVRLQGYSGDVCVTCQGSRLRWAGHCQVCEDCGSTTGCS